MQKLTPTMIKALRVRLRVEEDDPSMDDRIAAMSGPDIVREMSAWRLGDEKWADMFAMWMVHANTTAEEIYKL